jgi:hypothetical protein
VNLSADVTEHHHLLHLSPSIKSPAEATQQTLAHLPTMRRHHGPHLFPLFFFFFSSSRAPLRSPPWPRRSRTPRAKPTTPGVPPRHRGSFRQRKSSRGSLNQRHGRRLPPTAVAHRGQVRLLCCFPDLGEPSISLLVKFRTSVTSPCPLSPLPVGLPVLTAALSRTCMLPAPFDGTVASKDWPFGFTASERASGAQALVPDAPWTSSSSMVLAAQIRGRLCLQLFDTVRSRSVSVSSG